MRYLDVSVHVIGLLVTKRLRKLPVWRLVTLAPVWLARESWVVELQFQFVTKVLGDGAVGFSQRE